MRVQMKSKIVATMLILMISFVTWGSCPPPADPCWDMGNQANWGNWNDTTLECETPSVITAGCWKGCDCSPE